MYKTTFTASPLVFGAFPSLHSADACLLAFFVVYIFGPRSIPFALSYVFWIWWATMYLGHHYVVDLVGGGAYAVIAFWLGSYFLPPVLPPMDDEEYDQDDGYDIAAGSTLNKFALDRNHQALHPQEKQVLFQAPADYDDDQDNEHNGKDRNYKDYKDRMTNDIRISEMKRPMEEPLWPQDGEEEFSTPTTATSTGDLSDMGGKMRFQNGYTAVDMMELKSLVVQLPMLAELEIEEEAGAGAGARQSRSEPASPTGSHHSSSSAASSSSSTTASSWTRKSKRVVTSIQTSSRTARTSGGVRQSWNGWQGYESWIEVLARVHSPKTSPRNSPKTSPSPSPRSSTGQSPVSMV
ncbi:Aureobasidin resistance protein Aur1, partial [Lunasporangiospora selenospora]